MRRILMTTLTATAMFAVASPASADITMIPKSQIQGTLVHGLNIDQNATVVTGDLGVKDNDIVRFTGDTTQTASTTDNMTLQKGTGQADVTGTIISGNTGYGINSGNIYLSTDGTLGATPTTTMQDIEFSLTASDLNGATGVMFNILAAEPGGGTQNFTFNNTVFAISGETFFAFLASNGESIINVGYTAVGGTLNRVAQVRIDEVGQMNSGVPEPATWAMMLLGFGGIGMAMRRSRKAKGGRLLQIA